MDDSPMVPMGISIVGWLMHFHMYVNMCIYIYVYIYVYTCSINYGKS